MRPVVVTRELDCASDRAALWTIVSDTERLNRAVGLGQLDVSPLSDGRAARYLVATEQGGFRLEYEERPFEWVEGASFSVKRVVRRGLVSSVTTTFELTPRDGGTHVRAIVEVEPKSMVTGLLAKLSAGQVAEKMLHEIGMADAELQRGVRPRIGRQRSPANPEAVERARAALFRSLDESEKPLGTRLLEEVLEAPDSEVDRMRPFELAAAWNADRRQVLSVCLKAVIAGLLELTWEIICPSCLTASGRVPTLKELGNEGHCQLCDLSFNVELDRAVEATFRPAAGVRVVNAGPYCIGGPRRTPHVFAQAILPPAGSALLSAPPVAGRYRLFVRGGAASVVEVSSTAPAEVAASVDESSVTPNPICVGLAGVIRLSQAAQLERHAKLERLEWASNAATAHFVTTLPEFRRLFARDVLRPGVVLRVARVALLFSDLTDSTGLYSRTGDAVAFGIVQDHFDLMRATIEEHQGTIVKTIGDAVMAAFLDEMHALRAALAMQRAFPRFRAEHLEAGGVALKLGVFAGPCYGVTANDMLDYFGQSVNIAARLQATAHSGEIVVTAELAESAERSGVLAECRISECFDAVLKGVAAPIRVARILADGPRS